MLRSTQYTVAFLLFSPRVLKAVLYGRFASRRLAKKEKRWYLKNLCHTPPFICLMFFKKYVLLFLLFLRVMKCRSNGSDSCLLHTPFPRSKLVYLVFPPSALPYIDHGLSLFFPLFFLCLMWGMEAAEASFAWGGRGRKENLPLLPLLSCLSAAVAGDFLHADRNFCSFPNLKWNWIKIRLSLPPFPPSEK